MQIQHRRGHNELGQKFPETIAMRHAAEIRLKTYDDVRSTEPLDANSAKIVF